MEIRKHKLYKALPAIAFLVIALFAVICFGGGAHAFAEGGSNIDYNVTGDNVFVINLDPNGKENPKEVEEANGDYTDANTVPSLWRKRTIRFSALFANATDEYYAAKTGTGLNDWDGYINHTSTDYLDVYFHQIGTQASQFTVTAKKLIAKQRFALTLHKGSESGEAVKIIIEVVMTTGNQEWLLNNETNEGRRLYIGAQVGDDHKTEIPNVNNAAYQQLPLRVNNYDTVSIDLERFLVGRKLYTTNPKTHKREGLTTDTAFAPIKTGNSADEYITINDLGDLDIVKVTPSSVITDVNYVLYGNSSVKHSFTITVNITDSDTHNSLFVSENGKDFWASGSADPNGEVYHDLPVEVKFANMDNSFTIYIPIVYVPSTTPKIKSTFTMPTSLNAGSTKQYLAAADKANDPAGFNTVRVRPEDLCDYPTYSHTEGQKAFIFDPSDTALPTGAKRDSYLYVTAGNDEQGRYYDIQPKAMGSADLTFQIYYLDRDTGSYSPTPMPVTVNFVVYGMYTLNFNIAGKKAHSYSINDKLFTTLKNDGYQIVGASLASDAERTYAIVSCENGIVSITPKETVSGDGLVLVHLVDMKGHEITLQCGLTIDLKAGNFFATWELWQVILFWVGIGVAALLLILLIIWLFARSLHRKKMDELETSAPTSAYIIKLNSTIAAAQAQQRLATTQAFNSAQSQMLQLGAGPASTPAANPNTLQLGTTPMTSQGAMSYSAPPPAAQQPIAQQPPVADAAQPAPAPSSTTEEIVIILTDEELLARIYEEKYKPRGMMERTFYKSKDLQQRELEKEKERIREDIRNGMSMEEACKSLKQREAEAAALQTGGDAPVEKAAGPDPIILLLGFDPADPIVSNEKPAEAKADATPEEVKLAEAEFDFRRLAAEMSIIDARITAINGAVSKTEESKNAASTDVETLTEGIKTAEQALDDKSADLVVAKGKAAREALNKEINDLEGKLKADKDTLQTRKNDLENETSILARLAEISADYAGKKTAADALLSTAEQELNTAKSEAERAADLAARAKKQALLKSQLEVLNPLLVQVNSLDSDIRAITNAVEHSGETKDSLKTKVATKQNELLSTTDAAKISELSAEIKSLNKEISDLDRMVVTSTKSKTDKNIEMTAARRKANEYVDKENMELDDIIAAEDIVIGNIALERLSAEAQKDKATCEETFHACQEKYDTLVNDLDAKVMESAAAFAETLKEKEDELAETQEKLIEVNLAIETCDSDDEKMNLTLDQMTLNEKVDELNGIVETMRAEGIKANLETKMQGEEEIENARVELDKAKEAFDEATKRFDDLSTNTNPLDLIVSGSGVISQDRKKIEAENLKKQLAEAQNAIEQTRLQAQMAQMEAERAVADAQRASDAQKAEAERIAQEALEAAEKARLAAEAQAAEEAERVRLEAEEFKRATQEEADKARQELEEAKRLAEEEAERARSEAEEARKAALEEAERLRQEAEEARRAAEEEAERARKEAEEAAERARIEAEEAAERARKEAEEMAERARIEAEEARKAAEEEAERAKKEAEEAAERAQKEAEEAAARARVEAEEARTAAE
ncbi:MAG: hypothetical protein K2M95_04175, partial [Clostridiales bacterium]|nr:hypothetical protein [Clostridiales bacterium]